MNDLMLDEVIVVVKEKSSSPKKIPPYMIIVYNDDYHTFQYVIEVFAKVFRYDIDKCINLAIEIHNKGKCIAWTGSKELAELKNEQIICAGPDIYSKKPVEFPLRTTIEPCN